MGLEYIVQPQVFLGGLTALGPGIQGLTEQYPLLTTYYSWTSTASVNLSSFPIPIDAGSIYGGPGKESSFIVSVGGVVQSPTQYTVDSILRTITFNTTGTVISAGIEFAVTQLATAAPSSQNLNYIKSVSAEFTTLTSTDGSFNNLIVTNLTALSTTVNVIDIRVTEISGFRATGDVDVIGDVTMTGSLSVGDILFRTKSQAFPNVFIGDSTTGRDITTGNHNFVFGLSAGSALSYASNNVFIGKCAGRVNITGQHNNFLGLQAGYNNTCGAENNFFGCNAGCCNTGGSNNNFLGGSAGRFNCTGNANNFLGSGTGFCNSTGNSNNFLGYLAGRCNDTGSCNNFLGYHTGLCNTTGSHNNFLGRYAGCVNTIGSYNTIIGTRANVATNALSGVIVLGTDAVATESHQIVLSTANVLFRSTGNIFEIGSPSLTDNLTVFGSITATDDVFLATQRQNVNFCGTSAINATISANNIQGASFLGRDPFFGGLHIVNDGACLSLKKVGNNGAVIKFYRLSAVNEVGSITVTTSGTNYGITSDYRLKEGAIPLTTGLMIIDQVQPREFTWKSTGSISRGFIAHELQAVVPEAVSGEKDAVDVSGKPELQSVDASRLVPYLVSAIKELKNRVEALEAV